MKKLEVQTGVYLYESVELNVDSISNNKTETYVGYKLDIIDFLSKFYSSYNEHVFLYVHPNYQLNNRMQEYRFKKENDRYLKGLDKNKKIILLDDNVVYFLTKNFDIDGKFVDSLTEPLYAICIFNLRNSFNCMDDFIRKERGDLFYADFISNLLDSFPDAFVVRVYSFDCIESDDEGSHEYILQKIFNEKTSEFNQ